MTNRHVVKHEKDYLLQAGQGGTACRLDVCFYIGNLSAIQPLNSHNEDTFCCAVQGRLYFRCVCHQCSRNRNLLMICKSRWYGLCRPTDALRQATMVVSEPGWWNHLSGMLQYAHNNSSCRRVLLARYHTSHKRQIHTLWTRLFGVLPKNVDMDQARLQDKLHSSSCNLHCTHAMQIIWGMNDMQTFWRVVSGLSLRLPDLCHYSEARGGRYHAACKGDPPGVGCSARWGQAAHNDSTHWSLEASQGRQVAATVSDGFRVAEDTGKVKKKGFSVFVIILQQASYCLCPGRR